MGIEKDSDFTSFKLESVVTVVSQGLSVRNVKTISYFAFHYCMGMERELLRNHLPSLDNFASGETASFRCSEVAGPISLWHASPTQNPKATYTSPSIFPQAG